MNPDAPTARAIADRLGRGLVRACYPAFMDYGQLVPAIIETRFQLADGAALQLFYMPDGPLGPTVTDLSTTVGALAEVGCPVGDAVVLAALAGTGVRYEGGDSGSLWTPVDAAWPEEDAAELISVMLRLGGVAIAGGRPSNAKGGRRRGKGVR